MSESLDMVRMYQLLEKARADEREQCCKDVCDNCRDGHPVERRRGEWLHNHLTGYYCLHCYAEAIRERAWLQEQESEICG